MLTITESAAKKIKQQLVKRGKGVGIHIGVKTTGCSGQGKRWSCNPYHEWQESG